MKLRVKWSESEETFITVDVQDYLNFELIFLMLMIGFSLPKLFIRLDNFRVFHFQDWKRMEDQYSKNLF